MPKNRTDKSSLPIVVTAGELKAIREHVGKVMGNSHQRLSVDVFNLQDRQAEQDALDKWIEEQRQTRKGVPGNIETKSKTFPDQPVN